ncbi:MAG: hypothetical protein U9P63_01505, partial [Patescibacteria group bacterium]|nr:hypothetical protein [Patescibacteria group bacterium]
MAARTLNKADYILNNVVSIIIDDGSLTDHELINITTLKPDVFTIAEDVKEISYEDEGGVDSWTVLSRNATIEGTLSEIEFTTESLGATDLTLVGDLTTSPFMVIKT